MVTAPITHIQQDERGVAWIAGTNTKVQEVAMDQLAYGWDAEEIHAAHPHLTHAQIHAALSFYYDHKSELDGQMEQQMREYGQAREHATDQLSREAFRARLAAR